MSEGVTIPWQRLYRSFPIEAKMEGISYTHDYYREGRIRLDGREYPAYLLDVRQVGDFRGTTTVAKNDNCGILLAVDIDGNDAIDPEYEVFNINDSFRVGARLYRVGEVSPSGDRLVIMQIYAMESDGAGRTRLTDGSAMNLEPSWSSNGAKITFTSNRDGNQEI